MRDLVRSVGYYELPVPVVVTQDVLGTVCRTRIGDIPAAIHTPLPTPGDADRQAVAPRLPGIPTNGPRIASPWDWVMTFENDRAAEAALCLLRVGVVLNEPTEPPLHRRGAAAPNANRLGIAALDGMDEWVEGLRTWIEVITAQDLDHHHPRTDVSYVGAGLWISKQVVPDIQLRQVAPIDLRGWEAILERIGINEQPPLEHLLARDARAAFQRRDFRRAAIDAGSAAEVVLGQLNRRSVAGVRHAGSTSGTDPRDLTALKDLLELPGNLSVPSADLEALIKARNIAVLEGQETDAAELRDILGTMAALLDHHGSDPLSSRSAQR